MNSVCEQTQEELNRAQGSSAFENLRCWKLTAESVQDEAAHQLTVNGSPLVFTWRTRPKCQELVMNEIEEYMHPVLNWALWEILYFVSFYKLIPYCHLELRVGLVNWELEKSSLFPDPAGFLEMQPTRKHLESCLQPCSRSTSQRLGLVKTVAGVGTTSSQSYNRRLDFIAMTAF